MKTLHWLNKQIAYILLFLSSQSGSGFILLVVFGFDLCTNALGIQLFFSERLAESLKGLGVSAWSSFMCSVAISAFASAALGLSIMQATLNNKRQAGGILSLLSVIISIAGLAHVGISVQSIDELWSFQNSVRIAMILGLGLTPPIVYDMNASLILNVFGETLKRFNDASTQELEKSFKAQTKDLGELDAERTKAENDKQRRKIERQRSKSMQGKGLKAESLGDLNFDELIKELSNN